MLENLLFFTNVQKILSFLIKNPDKEYFDRQISKLIDVSRAGTNFALRDLAKRGIVLRERRGRMYFYKVSSSDIFIRYLKILQNIVTLQPLIKKLKKFSLKIVLYGSAAKGENHSGSDIDIFVMTRDVSEIEKIQYIAYAPLDFVKSKKSNPIFYREVEKGIVLWQEK